MISSPCKACHKNKQPKEGCYKECKLLQAIQSIQLSANEGHFVSGIDCSEESRFTISNSVAERFLFKSNSF